MEMLVLGLGVGGGGVGIEEMGRGVEDGGWRMDIFSVPSHGLFSRGVQ